MYICEYMYGYYKCMLYITCMYLECAYYTCYKYSDFKWLKLYEVLILIYLDNTYCYSSLLIFTTVTVNHFNLWLINSICDEYKCVLIITITNTDGNI